MNFCVAFRTYVSVVLLAFCFAGSQARAASVSDLPLHFATEAPASISKEVFESAYFTALVQAFAKQVEKLGDASCLRGKRLDSNELQQRGRRIFVRYGEPMIRLLQSNIDERLFREAGGVATLQEIQRGKSIPVFAELARLDRISKINIATDWIVVEFNRFLIVNGYEWKGFTAIETADPALTKFYEESTDAFFKLLDKYAPETNVFPDLQDKLRAATVKAFNASKAEEWTPRTYFQGADKELAELCLVKK